MLVSQLKKELFVDLLPDGSPLFFRPAQLAGKISHLTRDSGNVRSLATQLSAIIKGHRPCSNTLEHLVRAAVRAELSKRCPGKLEEISNQIVNTLRTTKKSTRVDAIRVPEEVEQIKAFFRSLSRRRSLLCVEYRDLPRTAPGAKYSRMALPAAEAVANGLCFCMIQPFQSSTKAQYGFKHSAEVRTFLTELCRRVRRAYLNIRNLAREILVARQQDPSEIDKRIILFERNSGPNCAKKVNFVCGIQSRMFYAYFPSDDSPDALNLEQIWEWVAGAERDYFIQREPAMANVVAQQFFPLVNYFRDNEGAGIPTTQSELEQSVVKWGRELKSNLPKNIWKICTPEEAEKTV